MNNEQPPRRRARGPSSDDFAHDMNFPGPLRELRKRLDGSGSPEAPYTENETAIICAWLPPKQAWGKEGLSEAEPEIVEFSRDPASADAFVTERLASPFGGRMRELLESFETSLPSWFRRVNDTVPPPERAMVLKAALLRLYDLTGRQGVPENVSSSDSLPSQWRRIAS